MLQLRAPWALCLELSLVTTRLLPQSPDATWESAEGAHSYSYPVDRLCQLHHSRGYSHRFLLVHTTCVSILLSSYSILEHRMIL
jgi:hypothetical protein